MTSPTPKFKLRGIGAWPRLLTGFSILFLFTTIAHPKRVSIFFAGVAQLVEQLIRNQQVSGSSPLAGFPLQSWVPANFGTVRFHEVSVSKL